MRKEVNAFFIGIEEAFRLPGYIPLVSTITGFVRMFGLYFIQGFAGLAFLISGLFIGVLMQIFGQKTSSQRWLKRATFGAYHCVHASFNFYRGSIELIPVIGNLAVYFYDKGMKNKPILPYPPTPKK